MVAFAPAIDADQLRLRHEFLEMPGLTLTAPQAARLLGIRIERAAALLQSLEYEGLLEHTGAGMFRRVELSAA